MCNPKSLLKCCHSYTRRITEGNELNIRTYAHQSKQKILTVQQLRKNQINYSVEGSINFEMNLCRNLVLSYKPPSIEFSQIKSYPIPSSARLNSLCKEFSYIVIRQRGELTRLKSTIREFSWVKRYPVECSAKLTRL